jgi:hypothetical protein
MSTTKRICSSILRSELTSADIDSIIDSLKQKRTILAKERLQSVGVGSYVSWTSPKTGETFVGKVTKTGYRNVTVNVPHLGSWQVPAAMISVAN